MLARFTRSVGALVAVLLVVVACTTASFARAAAPTRIVSLMPSLTEDLFAIGAGPNVVAVSAYTDYPPAAAKLPVVASFTSIDAEKIVRLHPDVVIGIPAQARLVADVARTGVRVELIDDETYDQLFTALARVGEIAGREREASALAARLRARTAQLTRRLPADRPSVFVVLETNPIVTTGDTSFIAHLIVLAGGVNAAGDLPEAYPRFSAEALLARAPDVLVADTLGGLPAVLASPPWSGLRAVREHRVYILHDADILERPGPRYNDGLAWLIDHIHGHAEGR
jgi:iron complex transport system substrate-binding protein